MLQNTKLAVSCDPQMLFQIQRLGESISLDPDQYLFRVGDDPDYMYLVLEGDIFVKGNREFAISAGDFLGEIGFFAGTGRTRDCLVGPLGAKVWRIKRDLLFEDLDTEELILLTHFLLALAPHIHIRVLTVSGREEGCICYKTSEDVLAITYDCDHNHRAIMSLEPHLRGKNAWATAEKVWQFVSHLPFRFGHWHTRASQTLEVGFGTTTSKANLQVALFRALGMEAGYASVKVPGNFYDPLMPEGLRRNQSHAAPVDHDFCAVRLDNQWVACDATFTKEALQLMSGEDKRFMPLVWSKFRPGQGFSVMKALDIPEDISVTQELKSFLLNIDPGNMEAMNILLDQVQGAMYPRPIWMPAALNLLAHNPSVAFLKVLSNIVSDLNRFLSLIQRGGPEEEQNLVL